MDAITLTPTDRALLHCAILFFKEHSQAAFADCATNENAPLYKEFYNFLQQQSSALHNKLFAEVHVEDTDFIKCFNQQRIANKPQANLIYTALKAV